MTAHSISIFSELKMSSYNVRLQQDYQTVTGYSKHLTIEY